MIDFSDLTRTKKAYSGANGSKISVIYNGDLYMLKFPAVPTKNQNMAYTNSCISEYLGCKVYESIGIPTQQVLLGTYRTNKQKTVVACKDFAVNGLVLQDFASLKNQMVDSEGNGYGTELEDVLYTIQNQNVMDPKTLSDRFWDMFIVDAFIGNWDRHNGNWGFLYNSKADSLELAPVYDCGSSLFPQADPQIMKLVLSDVNELNDRVYNRPLSALTVNGRKINYFQFISSGAYSDCNNALLRIYPKIDMKRITDIIDSIPCINEENKEFLRLMLNARREKILAYSYTRMVSTKRQNQGRKI